MVNSAQRAAMREHFGEKLKSKKGDIRGTWLTIKSVLGNGKDSALTEQFAIGETTVSGRQEASEEFCKFFTKIGSQKKTKRPKIKADS